MKMSPLRGVSLSLKPVVLWTCVGLGRCSDTCKKYELFALVQNTFITSHSITQLSFNSGVDPQRKTGRIVS